jgi:ankyrin repeat protein
MISSIIGIKQYIISDILKSDRKKFENLKNAFTNHSRIMTSNDIIKLLEKTTEKTFCMTDENDCTLLHIALKHCNEKLMLNNQLLMEIVRRTPDIVMSMKNNEDMLPIHLVAGMNRHHLAVPIGNSPESTELMEYIIERTPKVLHTSLDIFSRTPLHIYIEKGSTVNMDLFLSITPPKYLAHQNNSGHTPLHIALFRGYSEGVLKKIMDKTPKEVYSLVDKFGSTPMHLTASHGNNWNINLVLNKTPDSVLSLKNLDGKIPLDYAVKKGFYTEDLVKRTPEKSILEIDKNGNTFMHKSCMYKRFDIVKLILGKFTPAMLKLQNKQKAIPLHLALMNDPYEDIDSSNYIQWKNSVEINAIMDLIKLTPKEAHFLVDNNRRTVASQSMVFYKYCRNILENAISKETKSNQPKPEILKNLNKEWVAINKKIYKQCVFHKNLDLEKAKLPHQIIEKNNKAPAKFLSIV